MTKPAHPLVVGLVRELPEAGQWTRDRAAKWLSAAEAAFEVIYTFEDDRPATTREER